VGIEHLEVGAEAIVLSDAAQVTLNGIAQGYITDRIAELLRDRGWRNVLIDVGEVRALEGRPDGTPFSVCIRETLQVLPLANMALATSSAGTLVFSARQGLAHILHPQTGATPAHWSSVTVANPSATIADALSTALFLTDGQELERILRRFPRTTVWATQVNGPTRRYAG
jgi:thiamine biosynthesis lipoprotein